ncbi:hypothetical protein MGAD_00090 [Mycolicibacterium gadium]|uniref:Uncharacterized protein n=1 Tax=Mycolicibacterium gadium TaxID=1794 RepID=A0A7I7WE33_MYCGU|nr:hypothetical protein MGAD_00090 [Mycolicibacterium gadium]
MREVVVAETDEKAFRYAVDGMLGRNMREYVLPTFKTMGMTKFYKHDLRCPMPTSPGVPGREHICGGFGRDGRGQTGGHV